MSVAVWFHSLRSVPREVREEIHRRANASELPWYEPLTIQDGEDRIQGWSKCPPMSFETVEGGVVTIPEADWLFINYWGLRSLIACLCRWSESYSVDWRVTCEGESLGTIKGGHPSWRLRRHLSRTAKYADAMKDLEVDRQRAAHLRERYPELQ